MAADTVFNAVSYLMNFSYALLRSFRCTISICRKNKQFFF